MTHSSGAKFLAVLLVLACIALLGSRLASRLTRETMEAGEPSQASSEPIGNSPVQVRGIRLARRIRDSRLGKAKQDLKNSAQQFLNSLVYFEGDLTRHSSEMAAWRSALPMRHVAADYKAQPRIVAVDHHWKGVRMARHAYLLSKARFTLETAFAKEHFRQNLSSLLISKQDANAATANSNLLTASERKVLDDADAQAERVRNQVEGLTQSLYPRLKATEIDQIQAEDVTPLVTAEGESLESSPANAIARQSRLLVIETKLAKLEVIASGLSFLDAFWAFEKAVELKRVREQKYRDEFPHGFRGNVSAVHPEPPDLDYITYIHTMHEAKATFESAWEIYRRQQTLLRNEYGRRRSAIESDRVAGSESDQVARPERALQLASELQAEFDQRVDSIFDGAGS